MSVGGLPRQVASSSKMRRMRNAAQREKAVRLAAGVAGVSAAPRTLVVVPGTRLRGVLRFLLSAKTMDRIVNPTLADMQREWLDAAIDGRKWHGKWIRLRGYWCLGVGLGVGGVFRLLHDLWKALQ